MSNIIVAERQGKFAIRWDERRGSAAIDLIGFWDADDLGAFFPPVETVTALSRARHGYALLLFDTRQSQVMAGPLHESVSAKGPRSTNDSDRVALVLTSSLLKLQVKRTGLTTHKTEFFLSRNAADTWLHAYSSSQCPDDDAAQAKCG